MFAQTFFIHDTLHLFIVCFGVTINIAAIIIIILKTPNTLRVEYSLFLCNATLVELSSVFAYFLLDGRIFIDFPSVFVVTNGPCRLISDNFCTLVSGFMNVNLIHSMSVLALAFWYSGAHSAESTCRHFSYVLLYIPHELHIAAFLSLASPRKSLEHAFDRFYGEGSARAYGLNGFVDLSEFGPANISLYLVFLPIAFNIYILLSRQQIVKLMHGKKRSMSVKTARVHVAFSNVMSIHTVSLLVVITGMSALSIIQGLFNLHSVDIEGLEYDVAVLPALINPVLSLYFVRPYRLFIESCLATCGCYAPNTIQRSLTIQSSN